MCTIATNSCRDYCTSDFHVLSSPLQNQVPWSPRQGGNAKNLTEQVYLQTSLRCAVTLGSALFYFIYQDSRIRATLGLASPSLGQELLNPTLILTQSIPNNLFFKISEGCTTSFPKDLFPCLVGVWDYRKRVQNLLP